MLSLFHFYFSWGGSRNYINFINLSLHWVGQPFWYFFPSLVFQQKVSIFTKFHNSRPYKNGITIHFNPFWGSELIYLLLIYQHGCKQSRTKKSKIHQNFDKHLTAWEPRSSSHIIIWPSHLIWLPLSYFKHLVSFFFPPVLPSNNL